jgi:hypothetical protein
MQERFRQVAWMLGYILMTGEALWLFCSFLTVIGVMVFGLGVQSTFVQQYLHFLAVALSLFAKSLVPGVVVGFALLLRKEQFSLLPVFLVLVPVVAVAQSTALTVLGYSMDKPVSMIVMTSSIVWLVILAGALLLATKKAKVLWFILGSMLLGVAWGVWLTFQFV